MEIHVNVKLDEGTLGLPRKHYYFPETPKEIKKRCLDPDITGGIWIKDGVDVPETIVIHIK